MLLRPDRLLSFLGAVTSSVTVDAGLCFDDMKDLALSMRGLDPARVAFVTVPLDPNPGPEFEPGGRYYGRVKWDDAAAAALFDLAAQRRRGARPDRGPRRRPPPTSSSRRRRIKVEVLNGYGGKGAATNAAAALRDGRLPVSPAPATPTPAHYRQTVVRYGPSRADSARTLAAAVPGAVLQEDASLGSTLRLVVGPDFPDTLVTPVIGSAAPTPPLPRPPAPRRGPRQTPHHHGRRHVCA